MNIMKNKLSIITLFILFPFITLADDSNFEKVWEYEINYIDYANTVQAQPNEFEDLILVVDGIGNLNALDKRTGILVYQTALGKGVGRRGFTVDERTGQIVIAAGTTLYILDAKSGVILKQTKTVSSKVAPILTSECIIVFGTDEGNVRCHSRNLDKIFWQNKLGSTARIWSNVTMSKKHNKIYLITSNAGGIVAENRAPDTYSSSLVAIDISSGSIEFSHQMIKDDVWDFDGVGKPIYIEGFINDDGEEYDLIIGLNKTGTIFAVNAEDGSSIKSEQFKKKKFFKGTGVNASVNDSQIIPSWPTRINEIFLTPDNLRLDEMKPEVLRHARFEEFLPPSLDYDVITRGIHGGPEWQGGVHYKNNEHNLLAIPFNNTSWILRLKYVEKDSYIWQSLKKLKVFFLNTVNFTKNTISSIKETILGEKKNLVKNSEEYLEKNSGKTEALIVDNAKTLNPWILTAWSDSDSSRQLKDKIHKFTNIKAFNNKYYKHCASCHRNDRAGRYQSELVGDGFVPSLVGYSLTEKYKYGKNYDNFVSLHKSDVDVTKEEFDKILKFYDKYDRQQLNKGNLKVNGFWQALLGNDTLPLNKGPWGGVAITNLNTGKKIKDITVGKMKKSDGSSLDSSIIFGGLGPVNSNGETLLVGTVDPKAYYISIPEAKVLHSFDLKRPGSAAPYLTKINGCEAWVIIESGGRFSFYDKSLNGYTVEMFVNKSKCGQ
jgi:hypothetical protein